MKILVPGREQAGWATEAFCSGSGNGGGGCGAKLLVEQADLFRTQSNDRDGAEYFETFRCPACRMLTDLPRHTVPRLIVSQLGPEKPQA